MKKRISSIWFILFFILSCSPKLIPPQEQYRDRVINAQVNATFRAVEPSLMKTGYAIVERDISTGMIKAKKINGDKILVISVRNHPAGGSHVKIKLIVRKKGRLLRVPEKAMHEIDMILDEIRRLAADNSF